MIQRFHQERFGSGMPRQWLSVRETVLMRFTPR